MRPSGRPARHGGFPAPEPAPEPAARRWAGTWTGPLPSQTLPLLVAVLLALSALPAAPAAASPPLETPFREVAAEVGLDFVHFNGMTGRMHFPEMMGPAVALLDHDGDGDLDVYVLQGTLLGEGEVLDDAILPPAHDPPQSDRLYRNELVPRGELAFTDVTGETSGIPVGGYGNGVAAGDFDNDGRTDLYLAQYASNVLLRNVDDASFADVTGAAGADDPRWSAAAAFVDFDRDGWLDLFVVNYVDFSVAENPACYAPSSRRDYCGPSSFPPLPDRLLRNRGDGTFEDVSAASGIGAKAGPGLGVVVTDADRDGWPDLYVANDGAPNFLWLNQGDGTFRDEALLAGAAVNGQGRAEAGMGVDADDFDNDGDEDVFLAHLMGETNTLYVNDGDGNYTDHTNAAGLGAPSLPFTAFGAGWLDVDNDGFLDLVVTNGAQKILEPLARAGDPFPLDQPNQLFRNRGDGTFEDATAAAGTPFSIAETSRAAALGDLDDDGAPDVVVGNTAGPLRLLLNRAGAGKRWIGLRLLDPSGRDALGARVELVRDGAPSLWRRAASDGSFAAANDPRVLAGLGGADAPAVTAVRVLWPDGTEERFPAPPEGRYTTLRPGTAPAPGGEGAGGRTTGGGDGGEDRDGAGAGGGQGGGDDGPHGSAVGERTTRSATPEPASVVPPSGVPASVAIAPRVSHTPSQTASRTPDAPTQTDAVDRSGPVPQSTRSAIPLEEDR